MGLISLIDGALDDLVAGRVHQDLAPEGEPRPYIVYQQVGGDVVNFVENSIPSKRNARVQVAVWADTRAQADAMGFRVEDALRAATGLQTTVLGAAVAEYDAATKLRGTRQDFSFWS